MAVKPDDAVAMVVTEPREVPALSLLLGYGPMLPFAGGALAAWLGPAPWRSPAIDLSILWGCAILCFLSGVRRGVSFRTMGGPTVTQIATMLWLFCAGGGALLLWYITGRLRRCSCSRWLTPASRSSIPSRRARARPPCSSPGCAPARW